MSCRFVRFVPLLVVLGCGSSDNPYAQFKQPPGHLAKAFKDDAPANAKPTADSLPTRLVDASGNEVDLTSYRGKNNLVLVITRGIPQSPGGVPCPFCVAQAYSLAGNYEQFKLRDAEILVLFPGPAEKVGEFIKQAVEKPALPFPLLLDKNLAVCDRLGIRGDLAKPSTYILDKRGNVVYAYVGETLSDRPSVKALLAQLDKVQGGPPKSLAAPATGRTPAPNTKP